VRDLPTDDPADMVIAWEAVEELLQSVPEGQAKDALRMFAAGIETDEIAHRMRLPLHEVVALMARARIRVLTAALGTPRVAAAR